MALLRRCLLELRSKQYGGITADIAFPAGAISAWQAISQFAASASCTENRVNQAAEPFTPSSSTVSIPRITWKNQPS
jgi:hypothetical protein